MSVIFGVFFCYIVQCCTNCASVNDIAKRNKFRSPIDSLAPSRFPAAAVLKLVIDYNLPANLLISTLNWHFKTWNSSWIWCGAFLCTLLSSLPSSELFFELFPPSYVFYERLFSKRTPEKRFVFLKVVCRRHSSCCLLLFAVYCTTTFIAPKLTKGATCHLVSSTLPVSRWHNHHHHHHHHHYHYHQNLIHRHQPTKEGVVAKHYYQDLSAVHDHYHHHHHHSR